MTQLRCQAPSGPEGRRCDAELIRVSDALRLIGVFVRWESETERSDGRQVHRCAQCGWYNLFEVPGDDRRG